MNPDQPSHPHLHRESLGALRDNLLALHKSLIDAERISYEATFGAIDSQNRFLQLLIDDPWFAWLHPVSELVVGIDELLEEELLSAADVVKVRNRVRTLLKASEVGDGFPRSYFEALQREPDVVLAHADVMRCLADRT